MNELYLDQLLNINTREGYKSSNDSLHYHPYEPTPYYALDVLVQHYEVKQSDRIVDFGCGKGRLNFYFNYYFQSTVVGVEMNEEFYFQAIQNKTRYLENRKNSMDSLLFHCCLAQEYQINRLDNRFYFFNPFSIQIFMHVINNILQSLEKYEREVELILYYGSKEYIHYLEYQTAFKLKDEIKIPGLSIKNPYERFVIYHFSL
ncbi:methyltransferase [Aquibacillus rhizosphaerae]|uniref:Methyltransferase n=1 Tax=Aquibacillus rhizosphaerae TaxID=3051431 RepID=A0ABT7L8W1_9BACI|nr:methyltransferase [Aquibacillus sp. LR5S19]MDL4841625.1 methyltransferase [Aquibacillus sp. LR5S19]